MHKSIYDSSEVCISHSLIRISSSRALCSSVWTWKVAWLRIFRAVNRWLQQMPHLQPAPPCPQGSTLRFSFKQCKPIKAMTHVSRPLYRNREPAALLSMRTHAKFGGTVIVVKQLHAEPHEGTRDNMHCIALLWGFALSKPQNPQFKEFLRVQLRVVPGGTYHVARSKKVCRSDAL